jgi:hypothetical protein
MRQFNKERIFRYTECKAFRGFGGIRIPGSILASGESVEF